MTRPSRLRPFGAESMTPAIRIFASSLTAAVVLHAATVWADTSPLTSPPPTGTPPPPAPRLEEGQHFQLDPVSDGVLTGAGFGFSLLLGAVLGTGEITPPMPSVDPSKLLSIDRGAVTQTIDPHASTYSNIGLYAAIGYAVLDPVLSGFRDGADALLVDAFMYAESGSLALTLTDVTKIAVRRPRPIDYVNCSPVKLPSGGTGSNTSAGCSSTDLGLSFFSGHSSTVAALGATATYIAFVRSPDSPRPWITLGAATALTVFVSYERVRAGEHFPTDVIAGSMAGAAVGVLVPQLHRRSQEAARVWVGAAPLAGGGSVLLQGFF